MGCLTQVQWEPAPDSWCVMKWCWSCTWTLHFTWWMMTLTSKETPESPDPQEMRQDWERTFFLWLRLSADSFLPSFLQVEFRSGSMLVWNFTFSFSFRDRQTDRPTTEFSDYYYFDNLSWLLFLFLLFYERNIQKARKFNRLSALWFITFKETRVIHHMSQESHSLEFCYPWNRRFKIIFGTYGYLDSWSCEWCLL